VRARNSTSVEGEADIIGRGLEGEMPMETFEVPIDKINNEAPTMLGELTPCGTVNPWARDKG
jgi:hypothetical protein